MTERGSGFAEECRCQGVDVEIALAVRKAVAKAIEVEPDDLGFRTPTTYVIDRANRVRSSGWDDIDFVFAFEEVTGLQLPDDFRVPRIAPCRIFFWKVEGAETFGEWCLKLVPVLKAAISKGQDSNDV